MHNGCPYNGYQHSVFGYRNQHAPSATIGSVLIHFAGQNSKRQGNALLFLKKNSLTFLQPHQNAFFGWMACSMLLFWILYWIHWGDS